MSCCKTQKQRQWLLIPSLLPELSTQYHKQKLENIFVANFYATNFCVKKFSKKQTAMKFLNAEISYTCTWQHHRSLRLQAAWNRTKELAAFEAI